MNWSVVCDVTVFILFCLWLLLLYKDKRSKETKQECKVKQKEVCVEDKADGEIGGKVLECVPGAYICENKDTSYAFGGFQSLQMVEGYVLINIIVYDFMDMPSTIDTSYAAASYAITYRIQEGNQIVLGVKTYKIKEIQLDDNKLVIENMG